MVWKGLKAVSATTDRFWTQILFFSGPIEICLFLDLWTDSTDIEAIKGTAMGSSDACGLRVGIGGRLFPGVELLGFVQSPGGTVDADDNGMMDHTVYSGGVNDRIAEVIAKFYMKIFTNSCILMIYSIPLW
jgi:hypothetical protein